MCWCATLLRKTTILHPIKLCSTAECVNTISSTSENTRPMGCTGLKTNASIVVELLGRLQCRTSYSYIKRDAALVCAHYNFVNRCCSTNGRFTRHEPLQADESVQSTFGIRYKQSPGCARSSFSRLKIANSIALRSHFRCGSSRKIKTLNFISSEHAYFSSRCDYFF